MSNASDDAKQMRQYLAKEDYAIVGGVGGCGPMLLRVLDRLDELEWIVATMRATKESKDATG
jgi:hypothetical protein